MTLLVSNYLPGARVSDDGWFWWNGAEWVQFPTQRLDLAQIQVVHDEIKRGELDDTLPASTLPPTAGIVSMRDDASGEIGHHQHPRAYSSFRSAPGAGAAWLIALAPLAVGAISVGAGYVNPLLLTIVPAFAVVLVAIVTSTVMLVDANKIRASGVASEDFGRGMWLVQLLGGAFAAPIYLYQRASRVGSIAPLFLWFVAWVATTALVIFGTLDAGDRLINEISEAPKQGASQGPDTSWDDFSDGSYAPPVGGR